MAQRNESMAWFPSISRSIPQADRDVYQELTRIWLYLHAKTSVGYNNSTESHVLTSSNDAYVSPSPEDPSQIDRWIELLDELIMRCNEGEEEEITFASGRRTGPSGGVRQWFSEMFGRGCLNSHRVLNGQHREDWRPLIGALLDMLRKLSRMHLTLPPSLLIPSGRVTTMHSRPGETSAGPVGSGGFADVYKGRFCGSVVAIKVMRNSGQANTAAYEMAFCEAVIWKYLKHPNITLFHGLDKHASGLSLVSEWMEHGTIKQYLQKYPNVDRLAFVDHIAKGLKYLHDLGIVHGDLKSANIMINSRLSASLVDFGLAALCYDGQLDTRSASGSSLRWTAPEIMSPEDHGFQKATLTRQSDVYAFAITIWKIFTGEIPFPHARDVTVMKHVLSGARPLRPQPEASSGLGDDLWYLLERCWCQKWVERPHVGSVLSCIVHSPGSTPAYRVRASLLNPAAPGSIEAVPSDVGMYERFAQPFSEWLSSYVWRMCTTGYNLPHAYAGTGGFVQPQPAHLAPSILSVLSVLPPATPFLATWYLKDLPISLNEARDYDATESAFRRVLLEDKSQREDWQAYTVFRLMVLGCMLASKTTVDCHISEETWRMLSGLPVLTLRDFANLALAVRRWNIFITRNEWIRWLGSLRSDMTHPSSQGTYYSWTEHIPVLVEQIEGLLREQGPRKTGTAPVSRPAAAPMNRAFTAFPMPTPPTTDMHRRLPSMPMPMPVAPPLAHHYSDSATVFGGAITEEEEQGQLYDPVGPAPSQYTWR